MVKQQKWENYLLRLWYYYYWVVLQLYTYTPKLTIIQNMFIKNSLYQSKYNNNLFEFKFGLDWSIITVNSCFRVSSKTKNEAKEADRVILSFVVCDARFNESLNVVKSVLLFTRAPVYFVIFADDSLRPRFNETLTLWKQLTNSQLDFELHKVSFPEEHAEDWMNLFSKCAAQRLFIPVSWYFCMFVIFP